MCNDITREHEILNELVAEEMDSRKDDPLRLLQLAATADERYLKNFEEVWSRGNPFAIGHALIAVIESGAREANRHTASLMAREERDTPTLLQRQEG